MQVCKKAKKKMAVLATLYVITNIFIYWGMPFPESSCLDFNCMQNT